MLSSAKCLLPIEGGDKPPVRLGSGLELKAVIGEMHSDIVCLVGCRLIHINPVFDVILGECFPKTRFKVFFKDG
jgi:hypothetical protein